MTRCSINGFGRTGRAAFRAADERELDIEWAAINDVAEPAMLAHLLRCDSVYGPFAGTVEVGDRLGSREGARRHGRRLVRQRVGLFEPARRARYARARAGARTVRLSHRRREVRNVTLKRTDAVATVLTLLAVLVFLAAHESWGVPLIGDSHRWAAGAIALLGITTCAQGSPVKDRAARLLATLGTLALVLATLALATGSLAPLSLLVADIVVLWALSTLRHARHEPGAQLMKGEMT